MNQIYKLSLLLSLTLSYYLNPVLAQQGAAACNLTTEGGTLSAVSGSVCIGESYPAPQLNGNVSNLEITEYILTNPQHILTDSVLNTRGEEVLAINSTGVFNIVEYDFQDGEDFCVTAVSYNLSSLQAALEETLNGTLGASISCCDIVAGVLEIDLCTPLELIGVSSGAEVTGLEVYFNVMEASDQAKTLESLIELVDDKFNESANQACTKGLPICYAATNKLCYTYEICTNCSPAGIACDDGDAATTNDVEDGNCNCMGIIPTPPCPVANTPCDDDDAATTNDVEDGNCNCMGIIPTPPCPAANTPCDDGDVATTNDIEDGDCNCVGTQEPATCILQNGGGTLTAEEQTMTVCAGNNHPVPILINNTSTYEVTEYFLTNSTNLTEPSNGVSGPEVVSINKTGIFNLKDVNLREGEEFCIGALTYNLSSLQVGMEDVLNGSLVGITCCDISSEVLGIDFCTAATKVGITSGAEITGLDVFYKILRETGQAETMENMFWFIENVLNKQVGQPCSAGLPLCFATGTNLLCYTYENCSSGDCTVDTDNDGICNVEDNCMSTVNPFQKDTDGDGIGDACDDFFNETNVFRDCGIMIRTTGLQVEFEKTTEAWLYIWDKTASESVLVCSPLTTTCENKIGLTLKPNRHYRIYALDYPDYCIIIYDFHTLDNLISAPDITRLGIFTDEQLATKQFMLQQIIESENLIDKESAYSYLLGANAKKQQVRVFPNPTYQELNVNISSYSGQPAQIKMLNHLGQQVDHTPIDRIESENIQLDVSNMSKGLYYLQIVVNGELMEAVKVIIK